LAVLSTVLSTAKGGRDPLGENGGMSYRLVVSARQVRAEKDCVVDRDANDDMEEADRRRILLKIDDGIAAAQRGEHVDAEAFVRALLAEP
jgi:Flp pilus assembly CpaE family ATPase